MKLVYEPEGSKKEEKIEHTLQGDNVHDEILDQHKKMKDKPLKEKVMYYVEYYKWPALACVLALAIITGIAYTVISSKDYCFGAMIVNSLNVDSEQLSEGFSEYAGLDTKKYECYIDANEVENVSSQSTTDISSQTRFAALLSSQDLDITIYDSLIFYRKALNNVYIDLRDVLSDEDIEKYEDRFYYIDNADIEAADKNDMVVLDYPTTRGSKEEQLLELQKHMDCSDMKDPIAVGIVIEDAPLITTLDAYYDSVPVLGIIANSQRIDTAISFLHYIYDESVDFTAFRYFAY